MMQGLGERREPRSGQINAPVGYEPFEMENSGCSGLYGSWIPASAAMTAVIVMPAPAYARAGSGRHPGSWRSTRHSDEICSKLGVVCAPGAALMQV
jgi:hypothetical protein